MSNKIAAANYAAERDRKTQHRAMQRYRGSLLNLVDAVLKEKRVDNRPKN